MKKIILIAFSCMHMFTLAAQQDSRLAGVEVELNKFLEEGKIAGFSVAVVEKDKVIYSDGFGYRDYENKIVVDENTLFAIGSTTKAFTSSILGMLREKSKLDFLDSPLDYIPGFSFYNDEMNNAITIKDLMTHTTGMAGHDASWYMFPTHNKDEMVMRIAHQEPATGVRQKWIYNNFMFLVQGLIAEKITDRTWEDNINELIFKPLGMNRSSSTIDGLKNNSNASFGYAVNDKGQIEKVDYYDIAGMGPAGSINSSATDMANWLITWINGGQFGGKEILPANYVQEASTPQTATTLPLYLYPGHKNIHQINYGYGWMMSSYKGHYHIEHNGSIDGFSSYASFFPNDSIGIVVLSNQNSPLAPAFIRNVLADHMLDVKKTDWLKDFKEMQTQIQQASEMAKNSAINKKENTSPSHGLAEFAGRYRHEGYGIIEIQNQNDSLIAELPLMRLHLKHHHYNVFEPFNITNGKNESLSPFMFNFVVNSNGEISDIKLKIDPTLDEIFFARIPPSLKLEKETLQKFIGEYDLMGTTLTVKLKNEETLVMTIPGQPEFELLPTDELKFLLKDLEGYRVEFLRSGDSSEIIEVKLIQPNGTFKAQRQD